VLKASVVDVEGVELLHLDHAVLDDWVGGRLHLEEVLVVGSDDEVSGLYDMAKGEHAIAHSVYFAHGIGPFSLGVGETVTNELQGLVVAVV